MNIAVASLQGQVLVAQVLKHWMNTIKFQLAKYENMIASSEYMNLNCGIDFKTRALLLKNLFNNYNPSRRTPSLDQAL